MRQHLVAILHSPAELTTLAVALVIAAATGVTILEGGGLDVPMTAARSGQQAAAGDPVAQQRDLVDAYVGGRSSARASLSGDWEHPMPARRPDTSAPLQDAAGVAACAVQGAAASPADLSPWLPAPSAPVSSSPLVATAAGTPTPGDAGEVATLPDASSPTSTPPAGTPTDSPTATPSDTPTGTPSVTPSDTPSDSPPPRDPTSSPTGDATPDSSGQTAEPSAQVTNDGVPKAG